MRSYACKISVGANGSQDAQQIVGAANTDRCLAGHHISRVAFGAIVLGSNGKRFVQFPSPRWRHLCNPARTSPYRLAHAPCTCVCRQGLCVYSYGNGCERHQRIGLGGSDDTCIRYGVWPLVASPPSASRYATPWILRQGAKLSPGRCGTSRADVVTSIISLRVPIISHRHTGKEPGERTIRKILPSILLCCISLFLVSVFFFAYSSFPKASKWNHISGKKKKRRNNP